MQHICVSLILLKPATCIHFRVRSSTHREHTAAADRKAPDSEPKVEELKFPAMAWAYGLASARYMDSMKTSKGSRDSMFCKKKGKEGFGWRENEGIFTHIKDV